MLLALDTSAGTSVAVVDVDGTVMIEHATADTRRHAEVVGEFLQDVPVPRITAVVVGVGPGPFTGLRVGIAAARGFAWGADVPLWPVLSHDAIAHARYSAGEGEALLVATDARRREFFVSEYRGFDGGVPLRVGAPRIEAHIPDGIPVSTEVSAVALARVALGRRAAGLAFESADAVYLRSPDVTMPKSSVVAS